jgi:hypothetical protein
MHRWLGFGRVVRSGILSDRLRLGLKLKFLIVLR